MKQRLFLIFMPLFILTLNSNLVSGAELIEIPYYKFEVINDGKPSGTKGIARIEIFYNESDVGAKSYVIWRSVSIVPESDVRKIRLWGHNLSTFEGSISALRVDKDHFSFTIIINAKSIWNIVGKKKKKGEGYDISGNGLIWDDILKDSIKMEWRPIDKIVLPYTEVYP